MTVSQRHLLVQVYVKSRNEERAGKLLIKGLVISDSGRHLQSMVHVIFLNAILSRTRYYKGAAGGVERGIQWSPPTKAMLLN